MIPREQIDELKPFQARAIIEELRKGTVPIDYVPFFTVGRENWLTLIDDDFENYIAEGGAKVRFISGDYGDGKTHFMSVVRHLALRKRFAVSFVVLTREVPLQKFEAVYREIVLRLQTPHVFPEKIKAEEGIRRNPQRMGGEHGSRTDPGRRRFEAGTAVGIARAIECSSRHGRQFRKRPGRFGG